MPTYEMPILFRVMSKPDTVATMKRTAQTIFKEGGFIRKIENIGKKPTAYKITNHGKKFTEAQFFLYHFDIPPSSVKNITDEYKRDIDIVRQKIYQKSIPKEYDCQWHEETMPPPYRKNVQEIVELAKQKALRNDFKSKYFPDLKDYPFQT